jgi:ElaB/YqjD/DUF883 family membrane-anchored ribosome-binding protein
MAATPDMAPGRSSTTPARRAAASGSRRSSGTRSREDRLEDQIEKLQDDLKAIASSLANIAEDKVSDARSMAKKEVKNLVKGGQNAIDDVQDEFSHLEKQIKDTIREKPLTAVAGAIALGFILAVVSR